jgi:Flp pilus assembly protein TadG
VLFPAVLLLMFASVQFALHFHARNIAHAAASEAVVAGSTTVGTDEAAVAAARSFIAKTGDGLLLDSRVEVQRRGGAVSATVRGRSLAVLPGLPTPSIEQVVAGPVERAG